MKAVDHKPSWWHIMATECGPHTQYVKICQHYFSSVVHTFGGSRSSEVNITPGFDEVRPDHNGTQGTSRLSLMRVHNL